MAAGEDWNSGVCPISSVGMDCCEPGGKLAGMEESNESDGADERNLTGVIMRRFKNVPI